MECRTGRAHPAGIPAHPMNPALIAQACRRETNMTWYEEREVARSTMESRAG